ncbi:putative non-specific serine/threonine protein kinase [Medicago truncatula]|uniref:Putative non-specific serine/threonine protein kinase n=1 Tax=Medicago truncatula TaxID=3880 RepID=A0A396H4Q2_MEDTR|nr:putative non-specific serine/threonine protein kinase [Medicago truncatula]
MYSAGIVLLQIAIPTLRSQAALKNFNLEMRTYGYDLNKWRDSTRMKSNFQILDSDSGRGWDLASKLISKRSSKRRKRLSAASALRLPYFLLGGDQDMRLKVNRARFRREEKRVTMVSTGGGAGVRKEEDGKEKRLNGRRGLLIPMLFWGRGTCIFHRWRRDEVYGDPAE